MTGSVRRRSGSAPRLRGRRGRKLRRTPWWAFLLVLVGAGGFVYLFPLGVARPAPPGFVAPAVTSPTDAPLEPVSVAFLGDSYAEGTGTDNTAKSFAQVAARALGWSPIYMFAEGGTGYSGPSSDVDYQSRVAAVIAAQPDVVVVNGTRNDSGHAAEVRTLAATVFSSIRAGLPEATLVVIGPMWTSDAVPPDIDALNEAVRAAAQENGALFMDALHPSWLPGAPGQISPDGVHPTEEGHRVIGAAFEAAVRQQLPDLVRRDPASVG